MSDPQEDYFSHKEVSSHNNPPCRPCRTPSPVRQPSSKFTTPPPAPFSPSPISSSASSVNIRWQQQHQYQSNDLDLPQRRQVLENSQQLRVDQFALGSSSSTAPAARYGPDEMHFPSHDRNESPAVSALSYGIDRNPDGTSFSAPVSYNTSHSQLSLSAGARDSLRRHRSHTEHLNNFQTSVYHCAIPPSAAHRGHETALIPAFFPTSDTPPSYSPPLVWGQRRLSRPQSSRNLFTQIPRATSSVPLSSNPYELSIAPARGSRFQASDERTTMGGSGGKTTSQAPHMDTASSPHSGAPACVEKGPDISLTPSAPRIGQAPLPPTPPSATSPIPPFFHSTSLPVTPFRSRPSTAETATPLLNRFDSAHISTSSPPISSLKRSSPTFQLSTSPVRPRAYRKIGATDGLGLHVPRVGISGSQVSKEDAIPARVEHESAAIFGSSKGIWISSPPQLKLTLPRFEDLALPVSNASLAASRVCKTERTFSKDLRPHLEKYSSVVTPAPTLSSFVTLPPLRSTHILDSGSYFPPSGLDGDEADDRDSLICSSDPESEAHASQSSQPIPSATSISAPFSGGQQQTTLRDGVERRSPTTSTLGYGYVSSSPRLHASSSSFLRQRVSTSTKQEAPRLSRILRSHSDGSNARASLDKYDERSFSDGDHHGTARSSVTSSSTTVQRQPQAQHQDGNSQADSSARYDLINHAHHLKLFLSCAPELLLAQRLGDIPELMVESQAGARTPSPREAPVPGSIFITLPRGSEYGRSVLDGTWSALTRSGRNEISAGLGSSSSIGSRSSRGHQQQQHPATHGARHPSQMDLMLSTFETFYIPQSKARQRLEKARQVNASKSGSRALPTSARTGSHTSMISSRSHLAMASHAQSSSSSSDRSRPVILSSMPPAVSAPYPAKLPAMPIFHRFPLPTNNFDEPDQGIGEVGGSAQDHAFVSCVLWNGQMWLTGTDICRIVRFRFEAFGRKIVNINKFHEGIYSDLRNIKAGAGASCEEPKSPFLEALYIYETIQSAKRQKTFQWFPIAMHDQLFLDQLSRDYERSVRSEPMCTEAVREPALSFVYNGYLALADQLGLGDVEAGRPAPLHHPTVSPKDLLRKIQVDEAALYAMAMGVNKAFLPAHGLRR
ncbi:hypothetical protein CF326_g6728 [Tilletia indica]|nr:hypothetical protein CF326_g6728 [Tilletia indica]